MPAGLIDALRQYRPQLLRLRHVIGCGVGFKEQRGQTTGVRSLIVFVERKQPATALSLADRVPRELGGVPTDVIAVGRLRLLASRTARVRPAPPGVSIGHYRVTAGTFGAVVYDEDTGRPLILSNNHVLANITDGRDGRAQLGDPVYQPGTYDAGAADDTIGHLLRFAPVYRAHRLPAGEETDSAGPGLNRVDAALAEPISPDVISPYVMGLGEIRGTAAPQVGARVWKSGRTSGVTEGRIRAVAATLNVSMGEAGTSLFEDQIVTSPMAEPGDSGSVGLTEDRRIVGLLFAGSPLATLFNTVENVSRVLRVRFTPA